MDILNFSKIKDTLTDYLKVKFELFKLDMTEHISNILAQLIAFLVILIVLTFVILFLSIGLSQYFNTVLESNSLGYVIVAGIYFIALLIVIYLLKSGKLKSFFETALTSNFSTEMESNEEE